MLRCFKVLQIAFSEERLKALFTNNFNFEFIYFCDGGVGRPGGGAERGQTQMV